MIYICFSIQNMACTVNSDVAVQTLDLVKQVRAPPVLSEVPHELSTASHSKECKRSPQQFIPAGFPLRDQPPTGTEDSARPLTTQDMVRSGRVSILT